MVGSLDYNPPMPSITEFHLSPLSPADQPWVAAFISAHWGAPEIVSRGHIYDASRLPGFAAYQGEQIAGLVTYHIQDEACEIVSLDSLIEGFGIGTALVQAVAETARQSNCCRLWLITTNDNLHAIRFYQKRGFHLRAVFPNALAYSRQIKPSIPELGLEGIPLRDELEFELFLSDVPVPSKAPDFPQKLSRRTLYTSNWVSLHVDKIILPTGRVIDEFHVVDFPRQAVAALVTDRQGKLLFEQVYRYPTGRLEWEIPAGGIEPGEDIVLAAQREVHEETGFETSQARFLYTFYPANGNTNAVFHVIACRAVERTGSLDPGEIKSIRWMSRGDIEALIQTGELKDGFTLAAVLYWWWLKKHV